METDQKAVRLAWIDTARGIGIALVVASHLTYSGQWLRAFLFSFHIPLFFFLSGLVFSARTGFFPFLKKRFSRVGMPFLAFLALDLIIRLFRDGPGALLSVGRNLLGMDLVWLANQPLWFLCALFYGELFLFFLVKLPRPVLICLIPAAMLAYPLLCRNLPFCLGYLCPMAVFFLTGYLAKDAVKALRFPGPWAGCALGVAAMALLAFTCQCNTTVNIHYFQPGNYPIFFCNAFLGVFAVLCLAKTLERIWWLGYFGVHSLEVMCAHYVLARGLIPWLFGRLGASSLLHHALTAPALTAAILAVMPGIIWVADRYLPFLFGRHKS